MGIRIEQYKSSDYSGVKRLLHRVYDSNVDKETLEKYYLNADKSIIVAYTDDNSLVGCAFTEYQKDYIRNNFVIYVTYVAVDENYRKHGIGRKIFGYIEEMCRSFKCSAIELTSADFRTDAHAFYDALGFTKKKTTYFIKEV